MKRLIFILFAFVTVYAHGQDSNVITQPNNKAISIGAEGMITRKNAFFPYGVGVSLKGEYPLGEGLSLTATGAYNRFFIKDAYKNPTGSTPLASFIPVKVGAKYFIGGGIYTEGELGAAIETNYEKKKYFNLTVGIGYTLQVTTHNSLDFSFRYEDWGDQTIRFGALRVAYRAEWL
ncbi:hypothetical protein A0256_11430 [Mucilaginibacter sp. PAMC 26640]|nr:hypothetical protein A0256_11430 [Mucilaginibacter sp. PAMC 26640]